MEFLSNCSGVVSVTTSKHRVRGTNALCCRSGPTWSNSGSSQRLERLDKGAQLVHSSGIHSIFFFPPPLISSLFLLLLSVARAHRTALVCLMCHTKIPILCRIFLFIRFNCTCLCVVFFLYICFLVVQRTNMPHVITGKTSRGKSAEENICRGHKEMANYP